MGIKKVLAAAALWLGLGAQAEAQTITANFAGNAYDGGSWEMIDNGGQLPVVVGNQLSNSGRGVFRTVADTFEPSAGDVLTIDADLTWWGAPIVFLTWRDPDGTPEPPFGEPGGGYGLRLHPSWAHNGHTAAYKNGSIFSGVSDAFYPDVPSGFYDAQPIHVNVVDDGTTATVTLTNSLDVTYTMVLTGVSGYASGHVVFSGDDGSAWDNLRVKLASPGAAAVAVPTLSEWGLSLLAAALLALMVRAGRRQTHFGMPS